MELQLESGYLTTLYSCDDCQRRVPISCVRRQISDPWLTLTTVDETGDGALSGPLPDVGSSVQFSSVIYSTFAYRHLPLVALRHWLAR